MAKRISQVKGILKNELSGRGDDAGAQKVTWSSQKIITFE